MNSDTRLTILGCGKLGESLAGGLLAADPGIAGRLILTTRRAARAAELQARHGVRATTDNAAAVAEADVVVVAVKPQMVEDALVPLAGDVAGKLVVSTCAGVSLARLQALVPRARSCRAMPNTPARIREGMTAVSPGQGATEADVERTRQIFAAVGRVLVLDEKHLDVVTGLSGSGPAFGFVILEALADGGVMMGLPRDAAIELAAQTLLGAARLVLESGVHPAALKDEVTTPAGCTIAGLLTLEDGRIRSTLARAIQEATRVAGGLGGTAPGSASG